MTWLEPAAKSWAGWEFTQQWEPQTNTYHTDVLPLNHALVLFQRHFNLFSIEVAGCVKVHIDQHPSPVFVCHIGLHFWLPKTAFRYLDFVCTKWWLVYFIVDQSKRKEIKKKEKKMKERQKFRGSLLNHPPYPPRQPNQFRDWTALKQSWHQCPEKRWKHMNGSVLCSVWYRYRFFIRQLFQQGMCLEVRHKYKHKADYNTDLHHRLM